MENNNFEIKNETTEVKSKAKAFWGTIGSMILAACLAFLTVVMLNLNK